MTKKVIRNFGGKKTLFPKKLDFFRKSCIFPQNVSQLHRNLAWGFLGFFSGPSRAFNFLEWQCCCPEDYFPEDYCPGLRVRGGVTVLEPNYCYRACN